MPVELSAQPAEPHGNHPGPDDSVIVTSLPPEGSTPAWPHREFITEETPQCHFHFPEFQGSSSMCCNPTLFCSCGGECHPHHDGTQLVIVSASLSQLAETALSLTEM